MIKPQTPLLTKTAAVYDRWLSTLGGGEQVAFAYAQALKELHYDVSLLTHKRFNLAQAEKKMGIDLKGIKVNYLPEITGHDLPGISEKYDVFINTSHLDYFANRSKNGVLSVFFPAILKLTPYEYLKRALFIPSFRKLFIYPSRYENFAYDQYVNKKIYKWLSAESSIVFRNEIRSFSIDLFFQDFTVSVLDEIEFYLDNKRIFYTSKSTKEKDNIVNFSFHNHQTKDKTFTIKLPENKYAKRVALTALTIPSFRYFLYNWFKKIFPLWEMRLHGGPGVTSMSDLESYDTIVTISEFCRYWIKKYWGLDSKIIYPPVNTKNFFPNKRKKNIILHVGRFFVTGHSKKQLELVKVFKKMVSLYHIDGWELHFVGSVEEGENHRNYFKKVKMEAKGCPVFFHTNASFNKLRTLFSQAKIYWHATGLGEEEEKNPLSFEHFGITTVEAMASGCVPVVLNGGGQKEIVTEGAGFKWLTRRELMEDTVELIRNPDLLKQYSAQALKRSHYFSREKFKKRFAEVIFAQKHK